MRVLVSPNFQYYFWSAKLRSLVSWSLGRQDSLWVQMEASFFNPLSLDSLIFIKHFNGMQNMDQCFTVLNTLLAWKDCIKKLCITACISIYSPIHQNPDLNKYLTSINIPKRTNLGIKQFKDLFHKNMQLNSFIDLRTKYGIPKTDFF